MASSISPVITLDCSICSNPFTDPRLLPCLHVYCKLCLESLESQNGGTLTCPSCYKTSTRPAALLPKHIKIERDVSFSKLQQSAELVCGGCDDNNKAVSYCEDCSSPICSDCVSSHRRLKPLKSHSVVSLQNPPSGLSLSPILCSVHPSESLKYYCSTCELLTCSDCVLNHKDHSCNRIVEVVDEERKALELVIKNVQELNSVVIKTIENVDFFLECLGTTKNNIAKEINKSFDKLSVIVEERRTKLLTELEETAVAKTTQLQIQKESLENASSSMRLVVESGTLAKSTEYSDMEELAVSGSIQNAGNAFVHDRESIGIYPVTNCTLSFKIPCEFEMISVLGNIRNHSHYAPLCSLVDINPSLAVGVAKGCKSVLILQTRDRKGEDLTEGGASVKGKLVSGAPDKLLTIDCEVKDFDNGKYEITFTSDVEREFTLEITIDGINIQPKDSPLMVQVRDYAAITLDEHCGFNTGNSPTFIDIGFDNTVFICTKNGVEMYVNKEKSNEILGSLIGCSALRGVAVNQQNGIMFAACWKSNKIVKASLNGKVIASVGSTGCSSTVNLFQSMGVCLTKVGGQLLIATGKHNVQVLDGELSLVRTISCLAAVWGVSVDHKGNIHAAASDRVEVFNTNGKKICEYGKGHLQKACDVAFLNSQCHQSSYSFVSDHRKDGQLFIFDWLKDTIVHSVSVLRPVGVAIDQSGAICICNFCNNRVYLL